MSNRPSPYPFLLTVLSLGLIACNLTQLIAPPAVDQAAATTPPQATDAPIEVTAYPVSEPATRIEEADQALFNGDWDRAIAAYDAARANDDPAIQSAALYGIARTHYAAGDYNAALAALTELISVFPDANERAPAFFLLGETFYAMGSYPEAASSFGEYASLRPGLLDRTAYQRQGDALIAAGSTNEAIAAYQSALGGESVTDRLAVEIKIADAYAGLQDHSTAIVTYQDVLARSGNDFTKANMLRKIGESYLAIDDQANAFSAFQQAVNDYPLSYDSYIALTYLVDAEQPVNELNRGLINYTIGQYGLAVAAFDRYMESNPDHDDAAHFYKGMSFLNTSQYNQAIAEFQELIDDHPDGRFYASAYDEIAYTYYFHLDDHPTGIAKYLEFADAAPQHPETPELLFFAARAAETNGQLSEAATIWRRIGVEYSLSEYGFDGFFLAGITSFRLRDYTTAEADFQSTLALGRTNEQKAQAYFWIGKAKHALGDIDNAVVNWQQAATLDPTGYYSEMARLKLEGRAPFTSAGERSYAYDAGRGKLEAQAWMVAIFGIPDDTDFSPAPLQADPRFVRGNELWNLGLYEEARLEFESLRNAVLNDPLQTYRLATHLLDIGLYRSGIIAARQVLTLADLDDAGTLTAPRYFNHLRFGLYFDELIFPAAESYNFDPLFLYSLIRQESLFEGFVTSSAGARGLMQIVPGTGEQIYNSSGWPTDYVDTDLYRPLVNITYGADYLASQRNLFGDKPFVILSAYNGGPGSASAWSQIAPDDPDLYVEIVRFSETRRYLRSILELYMLYDGLYTVSE